MVKYDKEPETITIYTIYIYVVVATILYLCLNYKMGYLRLAARYLVCVMYKYIHIQLKWFEI